MARPRTPIGTFGDITYVKAPGGESAPARGSATTTARSVASRRPATTRKAAERNLKQKLAARAHAPPALGELTADSSFTQLVEVWLADLDLEGKLAPSTRALYERNMRQLVHARLRELHRCARSRCARSTSSSRRSRPPRATARPSRRGPC